MINSWRKLLESLCASESKEIRFSNGLIVYPEKIHATDLLILRHPEGDTQVNSARAIYKIIKKINPLCMRCNNIATERLSDGYLACPECAFKLSECYFCILCKKRLPTTKGTQNRINKSFSHCSEECRKPLGKSKIINI